MAYWDFIPGFANSPEDDEFCALVARNYTYGEMLNALDTALGLNN